MEEPQRWIAMPPAPPDLNPVSITSGFAVSTQVFPAHLDKLAHAGFQRILCVRPDNEEDAEDQPPRFMPEVACLSRGLAFSHIPIESGAHFPEMALRAGAHLFSGTAEKTLAFCLTGIRSVRLWALSNALSGAITPQEIIKATDNAGYDLNPFAGDLHRLALGAAPIYVSDDFANMI